MTSKELETFLEPIILYMSPVLFLFTMYLAYKYKTVRYIIFGYYFIFIWLLSALTEATDDSSNPSDEIDDNNANPNMVGTTAFYRKQQDER